MGWEREGAGKLAGLRTYMLVCRSATLFVRLGILLIAEAVARFPSGALRADPAPTIKALAVGISFMTTAAGLLAAAAIGIAIAINRHIVACGITLIFLLVLRMLAHLERQLKLK